MVRIEIAKGATIDVGVIIVVKVTIDIGTITNIAIEVKIGPVSVEDYSSMIRILLNKR